MKQALAAGSIAALMALPGAIGHAHAAEPGAAFGPYVEIAAGFVHSQGDFAKQVERSLAGSSQYRFTSADYDRSGGAGGRVALGWTFHPNLAFEAGYSELGRYDTLSSATILAAPGGTAYRGGHFRARAATVDAIGQFAISPQATLTARLGVAHVEQTYSQSIYSSQSPERPVYSFPSNRQYRLHWGVGGRYALTDKTAVTLNYTRVENVGHDFSPRPISEGVRAGTFSYGLLAVGLRYTF